METTTLPAAIVSLRDKAQRVVQRGPSCPVDACWMNDTYRRAMATLSVMQDEYGADLWAVPFSE